MDHDVVVIHYCFEYEGSRQGKVNRLRSLLAPLFPRQKYRCTELYCNEIFNEARILVVERLRWEAMQKGGELVGHLISRRTAKTGPEIWVFDPDAKTLTPYVYPS